MRKRGKSDANQSAIVKGLRKFGASVWVTSSCGSGKPDIVVGYSRVNFPMEIKADKKKKLTPMELEFARTWNGTTYIIYSLEDAISIITARF